jgi:hypothetical protein
MNPVQPLNPPRVQPGPTWPLTPPRIHFIPDSTQPRTECGYPRTERGTLDWARVTCSVCYQTREARLRAEALRVGVDPRKGAP